MRQFVCLIRTHNLNSQTFKLRQNCNKYRHVERQIDLREFVMVSVVRT